MRDYTLYLNEFNKYLILIGKSGRVPSEDDVNYFVEKMWMKSWWAFDNNDYTGASTFRGVDITDMATQQKILDKTDLSYGEYVQEATELLMGKLKQVVGQPSSSRPTAWSTAPISVESLAYMYGERDGVDLSSMKNLEKRNTSQFVEAEGKLNYIKNRIAEYNSVVVPYQLRKTMHHELMLVHFSTSSGRVYPGHEGRLKIHSEAEIEDFMRDYITEEHRGLWFSFSETGKDYKASVIDIDFHGVDMSEKEKKKVVKQVAKKMIAAGHPILIQFSGTGYHVWFGRGSQNIELSDRHVIQAVIRKALGKIQGATYDSTEAKIENMAHLDITHEAGRALWSMFFGLHYKPAKKKAGDETPPYQGTGFAKVPLTLDSLDSFDPQHDAHPETVLRNFGKLSNLVDKFFDEVEVGYGYEDEDSVAGQLPCSRNESPEPEHPLAQATIDWKQQDKFVSYDFLDSKEFFDDKKDLVVTPKFNGTLCAIHFKMRGGHKVGGRTLTTTRNVISRKHGQAATKSPVRTIMSTKGGVILWDNHITREFEDTCVKRGIKEALFVGELFEYDAFGVVRGPQAVTTVILRKDISSSDFKQLRFALIDVLSIDNKKYNLDYKLRHAELLPFEGDRVKVVSAEHLTEGIPFRLDALWQLHVTENQQEGLVIHHNGNRYKVKRKHTLDAVIIGVSKTSKSWLADRKNRHTFHVAVAKDTKFGSPTYVHIGPVNWGTGWDNEKQSELFERVMGEENNGRYANTINIGDFDTRFQDIQLVDPTVIVEVEYQHLSEATTPTFGMYYRQETKKTRKVRPKEGYRLVTTPLQSRRMVGPAVIKSLRDDKDPYSTYDLRIEQADGAGGLEIGKSARPNPTEVFGLPSWLKPFTDIIPITPSTGAELETVLICDKTLSKMSFSNGNQKFPKHAPWEMSIEGYRKLRNLYARTSRSKEFGGFCTTVGEQSQIFYGTSHSTKAINLWLTEDVDDANFVFHTHPSKYFDPPSYSIISGSDLSTSLMSRYAYGVEWELIVAPHGFTWYSPQGVAEGSDLDKAFKALKKNPSKANGKKLRTAMNREQKKVLKAYKWAHNHLLTEEKKKIKDEGFYSDHPSWFEQDIIELMNESDKCDSFFAMVFVPLYVLGPDFSRRKFSSVKANPSIGFYGVAKKRGTFEDKVIGPEGEPMPANLRLEDEFALAYERGKRADPDEKGHKIYLPSWNIEGGKGYPFVLGFPSSMQIDFADRLGGPSGASVARVGRKQGEIRATTEQFDAAYRGYDPIQGKKDNTLFIIQSQEMPKFSYYDPKDPDSAIISPEWFFRYDDMYTQGGIRKPGKYTADLLGAMSSDRWGAAKDKAAYLEVLYNKLGARNNPATGIQEWDDRVADFRRDYAEYKEENISQPWPEYALAVYPLWEFPLLEKGRQLLDAIDAYSLSSEEVSRVRQEYSSTTPVVGSPLENLLIGLDADEEEDEDEDFEEDGYYDAIE